MERLQVGSPVQTVINLLLYARALMVADCASALSRPLKDDPSSVSSFYASLFRPIDPHVKKQGY